MKKCVLLAMSLFIIYSANAKWSQRTSMKYIRRCVSYGSTAWFGSTTGIMKYDVISKDKEIFTTINTDLKDNYVNDMLEMGVGKILVSTKKGLSFIANGSINNSEPICADYPDSESRDIYTDNAGNIYTFSQHNVNFYKNGIWKSVDLSPYINHEFDIMFLCIANDKVWAGYEDNSRTTTTYYGSNSDDYFHFAIVADTGVVKLFQTYAEFPYRQGGVDLVNLGDQILLRNYDGIYLYRDSSWTSKVNIFYPSADLISNIYTDFVDDGKGNIWYSVNNNDGSVSYPVSYNISTGKLTEYLKGENLYKVAKLQDGTIAAYSATSFFAKNDTGWVKYSFADCIDVTDPLYGVHFKINGKYYLEITYAYKSPIPEGTFLCLDNKSAGFYLCDDFPFSSVAQFAINSKEQGLFKGNYSSEPFSIEKDSAFERVILFSNVLEAKPCGDGNVYFTNKQYVKTTGDGAYLTTWKGNKNIQLDLGYPGQKTGQVVNFDVSGSYIALLSNYYLPKQDSTEPLESFVTLYNTSDGSTKIFDKKNARMPDWYVFREGIIGYQMDTVPRAVTIDKNMNIWVGTSISLINITQGGTNFYPIPSGPWGGGIPIMNMVYDSNADEILCSGLKNFQSTYKAADKLYFFDISKEKWDSTVVGKTGVKGNMLVLRKLLDNRIWASDDKGYLYRYGGNGKFEVFDLKFHGKNNTGFKINDFCIDVNNYLHLGTDIGLFTNREVLTGIEEVPFLVDDELILSPNPATDYLEISYSPSIKMGLGGVSVEIFNVFGEKVLSYQYPNNLTPSLSPKERGVRIDVSGLSVGVYFVRVGESVGKFVKM